MDRIYLAIIAAALLLMIGAFSLHMTRRPDAGRPYDRRRTIVSAECSPDYRSTSHEQSSGDEYPCAKDNNQGQLGQLE